MNMKIHHQQLDYHQIHIPKHSTKTRAQISTIKFTIISYSNKHLCMKSNPLTLILHKSKLVLHFSSNPLNFYPPLASQSLFSSKPFSSSFSLYLSQILIY